MLGGRHLSLGQARMEQWRGCLSCVSFSPCVGWALRLAMHDAHPGRVGVDDEAVSFVPRWRGAGHGLAAGVAHEWPQLDATEEVCAHTAP